MDSAIADRKLEDRLLLIRYVSYEASSASVVVPIARVVERNTEPIVDDGDVTRVVHPLDNILLIMLSKYKFSAVVKGGRSEIDISDCCRFTACCASKSSTCWNILTGLKL